MSPRTLGTLAVVAVLLAALAIVGQRGSDRDSIAGASAGELFLPGLGAALAAVERIEIAGAGRERLVSLTKDGDAWSVAEQDGYPAAAGQVTALLIALAEARIVEEKTADPAFHDRLGVESIDSAEAAGVEVTLVADGERFDIVLGDAYGSDGRYARLAGSAQSVLIDRDPEVARDPSGWVAPGILAIPGERIREVEIAHADGERLRIHKSEQGQANFDVDAVPEGRELQYPGIANVTGSVLQNLELDSVARAPETGGERLATTVFRTFDGLRITAEVTAAEEGDTWISFAASVDEAAPETAPEPDAASDAEAAAAATGAAGDAAAEAAAINSRLAGWQYRIPAYQLSQLTRRIEDLLRAPPAEE